MVVAGAAQVPVPQVSAVVATGQKSIDCCQAGSGAVAPVGAQFGQGIVPLQPSHWAGWFPPSAVAMSPPLHAAVQGAPA